jgi:hypothetical protein
MASVSKTEPNGAWEEDRRRIEYLECELSRMRQALAEVTAERDRLRTDYVTMRADRDDCFRSLHDLVKKDVAPITAEEIEACRRDGVTMDVILRELECC